MVDSQVTSITPATHADRHRHGGADPLTGDVRIDDMFPSGGIIMWSGAIVDIPSGWTICDGTSSTPDLRDSFVIGAGTTYAVDATGGSTQHRHGAATATGDDIARAAGCGYKTDYQSHLPPYYALAYIMKT